MSIDGIVNYQHYSFESCRPEWQKLERYDYCDQDIFAAVHPFLAKLLCLIRRFLGK